MTNAIKPFVAGFGLATIIALASLSAHAETVTDQQLQARGCALANRTADYPLGIWRCPPQHASEMEPLPAVVSEDDLETGCVLTHKSLGDIFRGSFGEGVTTKAIAEAALEQYRKCG